MHVNDEELSCEYEGKNAEARVVVLRPSGSKGWRVRVSQYTWNDGVGEYYRGDNRTHTYNVLSRVAAVDKFTKLSAAMVAIFCAEAR